MDTQIVVNSDYLSDSSPNGIVEGPKTEACSPCGRAAMALGNLNDAGVCRTVLFLVERGLLQRMPEEEESLAGFDTYALSPLLTAKQVAKRLNVGIDWVRRHKCELGVMNLGGCGRGAELRFPSSKIDEYLKRCARRSRNRAGRR